MCTEGFKDHFSSSAAGYASYRPTYPPALFADLAGLCERTDRAWDCGCGNGQASLGLADHFSEVIATDPSAKQIEKAEPHARVSYEVAAAETSGLADKSIDLIVAAQAAHWFDLGAFYAEARRVARPGAIVALITYGIMEMDPPVDKTFESIYFGPIGAHWPPERRHVENGYREFPFPFDPLPMPEHAMRADWTLAHLVGYVGTWSATKEYRAKTGHDPVPEAEQALSKVWGDPARAREIRWPLGGRIGRIG